MRVTDWQMLTSATARVASCLVGVLLFHLGVAPAWGDEDDLSSLALYNGNMVETVSSGRSPRPASQTAENITVLTSTEIESLNAHTLADVLVTVNGLYFEMLRTPGTVANVGLQGSIYNHILVMIDNVPLNNLVDNFADINSVPVQMIERVEIVKGAASSSWGSALGGVVNVITKSPAEHPYTGLISASLGNRSTVDGRGEVSGTRGRLGYYLSGGKLGSDGLLPNNGVDLNNVYGKLRYDLPTRGSLTLTTGYAGGSSGQLAVPPYKVNQDTYWLISTLSAEYRLTENLGIETTARVRQASMDIGVRSMADNSSLKITNSAESDAGASLKVSWHNEMQRLVSGIDYDHVRAHLMLPLKQADLVNASADRFGVYLNDTLTLGDFALTPSARFDHTGSGGDLFSPSFGITYALTENSLLRGYTARGYSLASLNRDNSTEKVWTSQIGFESSEIPFLWLKGTLFRNDTWNVNTTDQSGVYFKQRQLKLGGELEGRTLPYLGTSLSLGYTFIDARDADSEAILQGVPRHILNFGVKYEDHRYLRALLTGHYVDWNANGTGQGGRYGAVIWDLHLGKKIEYAEHRSIELFLSVRNLFNGEQELNAAYRNPSRWIDGGIRCAF